MYDSPPKHPDIASDPTIWIWRRGWISRDRVRIKLQNFPFRPLALLVEWAGQIVRDRNSASGFGPTTLLWDSTTALAWPFADYVKHYETTPMPAALSGRFSGAAIDFSPPSPSRTPTTWLAPTNRMRMPCPWKSHPRHRQKFQLAEPGAGGSRYSRWWWWDWHLRVPVGPTASPALLEFRKFAPAYPNPLFCCHSGFSQSYRTPAGRMVLEGFLGNARYRIGGGRQAAPGFRRRPSPGEA